MFYRNINTYYNRIYIYICLSILILNVIVFFANLKKLTVMSRFYFIILISFLFAYNTQGQVEGGKNEKLAKLYNSGKYEACLYKADNLTYKADASKDPEPYLYVSMCFYELSKSNNPVIQEDYKDAFKQAVKYAGKFIKKDKKEELLPDNIDYINTLKKEQIAVIKKYYKQDNYRKSVTPAKLYLKLNRKKDFGVMYFIGTCEVLSRNYSQGLRDIDFAKTGFEEDINKGRLKIDSFFKSLTSSAFLKYSEYLVTEDKLTEALENLILAKKVFPGNPEFDNEIGIIKEKIEIKNDTTRQE